MERLRIKNFLIIKDADFEVGRFNVIIGSQASGKSIIARLLYFFRTCNGVDTRFEESDLRKFDSIFPMYAWGKKPFEIHYQMNDFEIKISYTGKGVKSKSSNNQFKNRTLFIPANRSSFSLIQDNIFALLSLNTEIDFFIKEFGSYYEQVKRPYANRIQDNKTIEYLVKDILKGRYVYEHGQDWIKTNKQRILLSNASSGQQEALPMLIVLSMALKSKIFIEEPEAHLFPISQKKIIELLAWLYNKNSHDFFLTTHSPYIPTAINCAILAQDIINKNGKDAVKDIFNPDFAIKYEDVKAYTIDDGHLKSILNDELRLISASVIDSVSDDFENIFNNLLTL